MEFSLKIKNKTFIRWNNWNDFIVENNLFNFKKNNNILLAFVTYNLSDKVIELLDKLKTDNSWGKFDILIVDNNSEISHFEKIKNYIIDNNVTFIKLVQTIDNLGGAGGNAIILEYFLSKEYDYLILSEDDAIPIDNDIISCMIDNKDSKKIIRTYCFDSKSPSYPLHFTMYPKNLIENLGIMDPRYFMRSDDSEFHFKLEYFVKKLGISYIDINKRYTHPLIKKSNGKYWQFYFAIRNTLFTKEKLFFWGKSKELSFKYYIYDYIRYLVTIFLYIFTGVLKVFTEKKLTFLIIILYSIKDYLFINYGYSLNKRLRNLFLDNKFSTKLIYSTKSLKLADLDNFTQNLFMIDPILKFQKTYKIKYSNSFKNLFNNGLLFSSFTGPIYPLIFLSKKSYTVEEFIGDEVIISEFHNKNYILNLFFVIFSFFLSFFIYIIILPFIVLKLIIFKVARLLGK